MHCSWTERWSTHTAIKYVIIEKESAAKKKRTKTTSFHHGNHSPFTVQQENLTFQTTMNEQSTTNLGFLFA
jgi:hypothetical protein